MRHIGDLQALPLVLCEGIINLPKHALVCRLGFYRDVSSKDSGGAGTTGRSDESDDREVGGVSKQAKV